MTFNEGQPLPKPPVPANCDLRSYTHIFWPIDLASSDPWFMTATDSAFAAMVRLMWASWRQVPASSLPNDGQILAKLGQITGKKSRILEAILPQWVLCSDGRLYHTQFSKIALEAWVKRTAQLKKTEAARAEKERRRTSVTDSVKDDGTVVQKKREDIREQERTTNDRNLDDEIPF